MYMYIHHEDSLCVKCISDFNTKVSVNPIVRVKFNKITI